MHYQSLMYEVRDRVAYVTFATPDRLNSITEERLGELASVIDELEMDESLNAVVISGQGKAFCVGLDISLLKKAFDDIGYFESVVRRLNALILRLEGLPIPVIGAVNGFARAGGFEIALGCDILLIANEAKIGDNHTHVGVMPGGGATQRLPRRIGSQRAKELIWTAKWLTGEQAVEYGLALRSVPLAELTQAVESLLSQLRDKPRAVLAVVKKTILDGEGRDIADGVAIEINNFVNYMDNEPYAREGFWASLKEH